MRWPLRNQIMVPMVCVMLGTLVGASVLNAYLSGRRAKQQIEHQLHEVVTTLSASNFRLTEAVLRQMRGLSGAEFAVVDQSGEMIASIEGVQDLPTGHVANESEDLTLGGPIEVTGQRYFHAAADVRRLGEMRTVRVHIFYPEQSYRDVWRQAVYPPLAIGAVALLLVVVLAAVIASRVTQPLHRLQDQVECIAEGDFRPMELPQRNDEVRSLSESVNRMAMLLDRYENEVRSSERLRTLGQLGGGIAHQMRNSATGCRLAIELHLRQSPPDSDRDCLDVANRQLTLMEKQLKRFMSLGKPTRRSESTVNLAALIENTLPLLRPYAQHLDVEFQWDAPDVSFAMKGDSDALEQVLVNLLMNAIEAAARCDEPHLQDIEKRTVTIELSAVSSSTVALSVSDTGSGPASSVQGELFEPFVSDKADGTGLGLSVAREIIEQHDGQVRWQRRDNKTCFTVELPLTTVESKSVEVARS